MKWTGSWKISTLDRQRISRLASGIATGPSKIEIADRLIAIERISKEVLGEPVWLDVEIAGIVAEAVVTRASIFVSMDAPREVPSAVVADKGAREQEICVSVELHRLRGERTVPYISMFSTETVV